MARKELTVVITRPGRDRDKVFFITEMSASAAEDWALRVFLALAKANVDIPSDIAQAGLAGVAALSLRALGSVHYEDAKVLLGEMMGCIKIVPDPERPQVRRALVEDDIEEVRTRLELRDHVMELHTGFSVAAAASRSTAPTAPQQH